MSQVSKSLFTRFEFNSREEYLAAVTFTDLNIMYIQNRIAEAAEEKVRLTYDPNNPSAFMQREAELQGHINVLTSMLNEHEIAVQDMVE